LVKWFRGAGKNKEVVSFKTSRNHLYCPVNPDAIYVGIDCFLLISVIVYSSIFKIQQEKLSLAGQGIIAIQKHEFNPFEWLKDILKNFMSINHKNLKVLYPQKFNIP
jgi:hypothetical protein